MLSMQMHSHGVHEPHEHVDGEERPDAAPPQLLVHSLSWPGLYRAAASGGAQEVRQPQQPPCRTLRT